MGRDVAANGTLFRSSELGPGLRLHLRRTKAFKTVTARLVFQAPLDGRTAARALVPRVLGRGTRRLPTLRDLQIELDRLFGATLSGDAGKIGERQVIQLRADWVHDRLAGAPLLAQMGALLAEFLHDPARDADGGLRADVIEHERKMMADEAAAILDDKGRYARHRLLEEMCRDESYARPSIGRHAEILALQARDVRQAHADLLARSPADLFLVGDLTWAQAARFARGTGLHRRRSPARLKATERRDAGRVRTVREHQEVGQAKLALGFRTSVRPAGRLYPALVIMNALFGGTAVGKLFKTVREKASLCYAIHSGVERTKGLVLVHAGIDAAHYVRARRLILKQLEDLKAGSVTVDEVALARGILLSSLRALHDSPGRVIDFALERAVNRQAADLDGLLRRLGAVTAGQIAQAARTVELDTVYLLRD
jgi:predicted Zn-dependent peptidase